VSLVFLNVFGPVVGVSMAAGAEVGAAVGAEVGAEVGTEVGTTLGAEVGVADGAQLARARPALVRLANLINFRRFIRVDMLILLCRNRRLNIKKPD
jgi:hypothetical protein